MNDLAEKALHGLDVARRQVGDRPVLSLAAAGFVLSCLIVVTGGEVGAARATRPLTTWLGLQDAHRVEPDDPVPGALMLAGVAGLLVLWLVAVHVARRRRPAVRHVWLLAGAWAAPLAVGPPLMDTTVYSYAAFGLLQRQGRDPYADAPAALGSRAIVAAIDPGSRGIPSSVGPLGTLVQHLAISVVGGSALGAVIALRVIGVAAAVVIGQCATRLGGSRPAAALAMTVLNPLLLLYVVSGAHLDGVMIAFVLGALVAAGRRRWLSAIVLACVGGAVSGQAFVVVPALVVAHWLGRRRVPAWLLVGRDLAVAAVTTAVCHLVVPHGVGWLGTVGKQFATHPPFAVASVVAQVLGPVVRGASIDDLAAGARITTVTAMVCVLVYLLVTVRRRPLDGTVGYSLLALGLLAPVLYPWYLLWGTLCLGPAASGERRVAVLALGGAGCLLVPPGFTDTTADTITSGALVVVLAVTVGALRRRSVSVPT